MDIDPKLAQLERHLFVPQVPHLRPADPLLEDWTHVVVCEADGTPVSVVPRDEVLVDDLHGPEPFVGTVTFGSGEAVPELWPLERCVFVAASPFVVPSLPFSDQ